MPKSKRSKGKAASSTYDCWLYKSCSENRGQNSLRTYCHPSTTAGHLKHPGHLDLTYMERAIYGGWRAGEMRATSFCVHVLTLRNMSLSRSALFPWHERKKLNFIQNAPCSHPPRSSTPHCAALGPARKTVSDRAGL